MGYSIAVLLSHYFKLLIHIKMCENIRKNIHTNDVRRSAVYIIKHET
jgi:hypothetical protein